MENKICRAPALNKGLKILQILAEARAPLKLVEIAEAMGFSVSSIQRIVDELKQEGYILRKSTGGFYLTNKLYRIAHDNESEGALLQASLPSMHDFVHITGESVHLSVAVNDQFVIIGQLSGDSAIRITIRAGSYPITIYSSGKVLLVHEAMGTNKKLLEMIPESERNSIATGGYFCSASLEKKGIYHLAVPIFKLNGKCIGALGSTFALPISGISQLEQRVTQLVDPLKKSAVAISNYIG